MIEDELRKEIYEKFGDKLASASADIKIIQQEHPPSPQELAMQNAVLSPLGKAGKYFVFLLKRGIAIFSIYATILDIPDTIEKTRLYIPKAYDLAVDIAENVKNGAMTAIGNGEKNGYLVIRPIWIADNNQFIQDKEAFGLGNPSLFSDSTAVYVSTSGESNSISKNTITFGSTATASVTTSLKT